jgi:hypothetical protein
MDWQPRRQQQAATPLYLPAAAAHPSAPPNPRLIRSRRYAALDVYHRCLELGDSVSATASYQYVVRNAPFHVFRTYMEAMDIMVGRWAWGWRGGG